MLQCSQDPLVGWEGGGIWAVDSEKNYLKCCHQMSDLKANIHRDLFRLRELTVLPDPLARFTKREEKGSEGEERGGG